MIDALATLLTAACLSAGRAADDGPRMTHVRALERPIQAALDEGVRLSPSLRRLVDRLNASDAFVQRRTSRRGGCALTCARSDSAYGQAASARRRPHRTNEPSATCDRKPLLTSASSASEQISFATPHRRDACPSVSRSPGISMKWI